MTVEAIGDEGDKKSGKDNNPEGEAATVGLGHGQLLTKRGECSGVDDRNGVADGVGDEEGDEPVAVEGVDEVEGVALEEFVMGVPAVDRVVHDAVVIFRAHGGHRHVLDMTAPGAQEYT